MASASPKEKFDAAIQVIHSLPKDGKYLATTVSLVHF